MKLKVHHIGYAVNSIEKSIKGFELLGYKPVSNVTYDTLRKVRITFLNKNDIYIELVEPTSEDSPVKSFLEKNGPSTYHICYETKTLGETVEYLKKHRFKPVTTLAAAPAINNNRVIFMYSKECGLIELLEVVEDEKE